MDDPDSRIRMAAMAHSAELMRVHDGAVPWPEIQRGFDVDGTHIFLGSTPRGIHRPTQMRRGVLSIKTTKPKVGRASRYHDELRSDGYFSYAFQGTDPNSHDNAALRESMEDNSRLLYFMAIAPGLYQILFPCFITDWNQNSLSCSVAVGGADPVTSTSPLRVAEGPERRYATIQAKIRLHQAEFRQLVLSAYSRRCAVSGFPLANLLDAAHIIPDRDERGRPEVPNGLCLSKLHHGAYDCNLLGIDADGLVHISDKILSQTDGPTLEALKGFHKTRIRMPREAADQPRRDFLAERFELFTRAS
jgi:putative restriction endonuclease